MTASYIYFIQAHGKGPIKIGTTGDDPRKRMVKIQSDCPWPVRLLGAIKGSVVQEKQIHLVLARWRTQGEWFEPHPIVLAAIDEAMICGERIAPIRNPNGGRRAKYDHPLCHYRAKHDLSLQDIADRTGLTRSSLSRFERWSHKPNQESLKAIIEATGLSLFELRPDMAKLAEVSQ